MRRQIDSVSKDDLSTGLTMPQTHTRRKQLFRAALALSGGMTQEQWAAREGLTPEHVSRVLNGRLVSRSLTERIDAFIREKVADDNTALAS
jgi:hypothetical protein